MRTDLEEPQIEALRLLSNFNHNTNLLLAGTEFAVAEDGPLASVLRGFGAVIARTPGPTTQTIWVLPGERLPELPRVRTTDYPLVIADASGTVAEQLLTRGAILAEGPFRPSTTGFVWAGHLLYVVDCQERVLFAQAGDSRIEWARQFMPVTMKAAQQLANSGALHQTKIGVVLILEPKTAVLALELQRAGAQVCVYAPANETDPVVAEALRTQGITVLAESDATPERELQLAGQLLDWKPELLIDDGAHLLRLAHQRPEVMATLRGASEETTSGVRPLRQMAAKKSLNVPVIAVNDALSKTLFDNRQGTGQTCAFAIHDLTDRAQNDWLVIGYGPVGQGVAQGALALGKRVIVAELDGVRALEARCAGYQVSTIYQALPSVDVIVSATGFEATITREHMQAARPGTVFAVAGGIPGEIEQPFTGRILADGHGVNYTAAEGNPIEIMDLSFACQLAAISQLVANRSQAPGVYELEPQRDQQVARWALEARGAQADLPQLVEPIEPELDPLVIYSANLVIPVTAPQIRDGAVAVRGGKIEHVGERRWVLQAVKEAGTAYIEEHWDGVITPGLVNAHTHLQYTDMAAVGQNHYLGFDDWSKAFDAVYDNQDHDWLGSALRGTELALRSGTTACADVVTDQSATAALHLAGMHGIAYWEVMGWSNQDWQNHGRAQAIADLENIPRIPGVGVSPHAPYSLEVQPLLDVPDLVRNLGMRLHIHLGEAHFEREMRSDSEWPRLEAPSFRALRSQGIGVSSTQFVDQLGVLGPDCHIAHGVYMSARDRELLRARGTSVALCPRSNAVIGLDMPPIADYLREGNQVSVGTDSLSSSPSLDLLEDVALLYQVAREQGYFGQDLHHRLFTAATLGGAGSLGLRAGAMRAGQLAVGASADLAFFDVTLGVEGQDAVAHLVEDGAGTCRRTIVAGITKFRAG